MILLILFDAERVKKYAMKFSQERWTFLGPGSEEKWHRSSSWAQNGEWESAVQRFKEQVILRSKVSVF